MSPKQETSSKSALSSHGSKVIGKPEQQYLKRFKSSLSCGENPVQKPAKAIFK